MARAFSHVSGLLHNDICSSYVRWHIVHDMHKESSARKSKQLPNTT
jgi:hypothetical protein